MIRLKYYLTNENQCDPIKKPDFIRKLSEDHSIKIVQENEDISLMHTSIYKNLTDKDKYSKIILLDRIDSPSIICRSALSCSNVITVIKNSLYRPLSLYNESYDFGVKHLSIINSVSGLPDNHLSRYEHLTQNQLNKLTTGWNYSFYDHLLPLRQYSFSENERPYDLNYAGTIDYGEKVVTKHRQDAYDICDNMKSYNVFLSSKRTYSREDYWYSLMKSKSVLSPWGNGELCYRDYEAILCGCVLIKPNTDHVSVWPDIFQNGKTYVACNYDFHDVPTIVNDIKNNWEKYRDIRQNAYKIIKDSFSDGVLENRFSDIITGMFHSL